MHTHDGPLSYSSDSIHEQVLLSDTVCPQKLLRWIFNGRQVIIYKIQNKTRTKSVGSFSYRGRSIAIMNNKCEQAFQLIHWVCKWRMQCVNSLWRRVNPLQYLQLEYINIFQLTKVQMYLQRYVFHVEYSNLQPSITCNLLFVFYHANEIDEGGGNVKRKISLKFTLKNWNGRNIHLSTEELVTSREQIRRDKCWRIIAPAEDNLIYIYR